MKNTVKMIIYFIVMIGINFGQCFGMKNKGPGSYGLQPEPSNALQNSKIEQYPVGAVQNPFGSSQIYTNYPSTISNETSQQTIDFSNQNFSNQVFPSAPPIYSEQPIYITTAQYIELTQQIIALKSANQQLKEKFKKKYSENFNAIEQLKKENQTYCTKQELVNLTEQGKTQQTKLDDLQTNHNTLQTNHNTLQTNHNTLQTKLDSVETELKSLKKKYEKNKTNIFNIGSATATNTSETKAETKTETKTETKIETKSTNTNVDNRAGLYSKFINVKTLVVTMLILSALISKGPEGAVFATGLTGCYLLFGMNKEIKEILERWERFKKRAKIIGTGATLMFTAGFVACTTRDKDLALCAGVCVPVSFLGTLVALEAE